MRFTCPTKLARGSRSKRGMRTSCLSAGVMSVPWRPKVGPSCQVADRAPAKRAGQASISRWGKIALPDNFFQAIEFRRGGRAGQQHAAVLQHGPAASPLGAAGNFDPPHQHVARRPPLEAKKRLPLQRDSLARSAIAFAGPIDIAPRSPIGPTPRSRAM